MYKWRRKRNRCVYISKRQVIQNLQFAMSNDGVVTMLANFIMSCYAVIGRYAYPCVVFQIHICSWCILLCSLKRCGLRRKENAGESSMITKEIDKGKAKRKTLNHSSSTKLVLVDRKLSVCLQTGERRVGVPSTVVWDFCDALHTLLAP